MIVKLTSAHASMAYCRALELTKGKDKRAMLVAVAALVGASKGRVRPSIIAELLGYPKPELAARELRDARVKANWWNEDWVLDVEGALLISTGTYGAQAE